MKLPPPLEAELRRLGVGVPKQQTAEQKPVQREIPPKQSFVDENGEPTF